MNSMSSEAVGAGRQLDAPVRQHTLDAEARTTWFHADRLRQPYSARTLAKLPGLRVVLITLRGGARIPAHHTDSDIALQTVRGHVKILLEGREVELGEGELVTLASGLRHAVEARVDSELLLTIGEPRRAA